MTSTNDKIRALFLAALMVLSVGAVTISFSGSAVANHDAAIIDDQLDDGGTYWAGQTLNLDDASFDGGTIAQGDTYQIRTVDDNTLVRERTAGQAGHITVPTSGLSGHYYLNGTSGSMLGGSIQFEVVDQDFSTTFNDSSISAGDDAGLEVDSARGTFNVTASASGLDEGEMMDIFANANPINDAQDDAGVIEFEVSGGSTVTANFTDIAPGDYEFEFSVTDTDASDTANITVRELDVTQDFGQSVYEEEAGDVATFTVNLEDTTSTWIVIGGDEAGWLGAVHVEDDDEDGEVTVGFNTYLAGQGTDLSNVFSTADDNIVGWANSTDFGAANVDANTNLTEPIAAGDYSLRSASTMTMDDDGNLENENDVATLILNERSTVGATVYTAPAGAANADDLDELKPMLTEDDSVRFGDRAVIAYEVSGIYGYLADNSGNELEVLEIFQGPFPPAAEPVNLFPVQANAGANRDAALIDLANSSAEVFIDADNNTFYLVLDTDDLATTERDEAPGQSWTSYLFIGDNGDGLYENENIDYANYVEDDNMEVAAGTFSLAETSAEFDNVNLDDELQVLQDSEATVSGTTNIAPGSEVSVRLRASGDSPFLKTQTVEVGPNGTFSATFDMSDVAVGQEFDASVRSGTSTLVTSDAVVVDEITAGEGETRTVVVTRTVMADSPTPRVETREVTREVEVEVTRTVIQERTVMVTQTTGQPGFGIAVAIVALLAAALLAVRRRD